MKHERLKLQLLKTQNKTDKRLKILAVFRNKKQLAANSRVLRVHILSPETQHITAKSPKVCNKINLKVLP